MKRILLPALIERLFLAPALCVILSSAAVAQETQTIDLQTAIQTTLTNNLQVKQATFQEAISDETYKQSRLELLPSLNANVSGNRQFGLYFDQTAGGLNLTNGSTDAASGSLNTSLLIFNGFRLQNQIRQNKYLLMSDKSNIEKIKTDLTLTVINTYLQALTNQDLITASEQQVALSKAQLDVEQKNFEVGNKTLADLSQAKSQLATNELSLTNAQNAFEISILELKQLMELNPEVEVKLSVPVIPNIANLKKIYSANEVFIQALTYYPDVQMAKYNSEAFRYGVKAAKGGFYPSLNFNAGLNNSYSSNASESVIDPSDPSNFIRRDLTFSDQLDRNFSKGIGLSLQIPIFNNFRARASVNIAKIRYQNALVTEQITRNNLNKIINQAVLDLKSADSRYSATQTAYEASKDAFEAMQKRYDVGLANSIELNTGQTNFNKAEFDFIQAKYDLIFRSKVIDFYLGNPINL